MEQVPPTQVITGFVSGVAAARDVHQQNTVLQFPERKPESQLQAEFAQRTGIWCPKPAREWFEDLMESGRFTVRELNVAWKAGTIAWDPKHDERRISTPWGEALAGYCIGAAVLLFYASESAQLFLSGRIQGAGSLIALLGSGGICVGVCWMLYRFLLWPMHIAMRIRQEIG